MREVVRCLERWIALDIVQNKTKIWSERLYSIPNLEKSAYLPKLEVLLKKEERDLIIYLKHSGSNVAHSQPPKEAVKQAILEEEFKQEDDEEQKRFELERNIKIHLVDLLDNYCQVANRPFGWDPLEPVEKQVPIFGRQTY